MFSTRNPELLIKQRYQKLLGPIPRGSDATDILYEHSRNANRMHDQHARGDLRHYHYIPFRIDDFITTMSRIRELFPAHTHFIDVGCGIGDKLLLAKQIVGFQYVSGIEYDINTFTIAEQIVGNITTMLINGDANELDSAPFDVIYLYCPIYNAALMRVLFNNIVQNAHDGAIIAEMLPTYIYQYDWCSSTYNPFAESIGEYADTYPYIFQKRDGLLYRVLNQEQR